MFQTEGYTVQACCEQSVSRREPAAPHRPPCYTFCGKVERQLAEEGLMEVHILYSSAVCAKRLCIVQMYVVWGQSDIQCETKAQLA